LIKLISEQELDRLAAVHVMGCDPLDDDAVYGSTPTINAADALALVEAMRWKGFGYQSYSEGNRHYFEFYTLEDAPKERLGVHRDVTIPLAITYHRRSQGVGSGDRR